MKKQLVVNWHILEACNFGCRYCFAHWPAPDGASPEVWRDPKKRQKLLAELRNISRYISGDWDGVRLNLAGGEPMLLRKNGHLDEIFQCARKLGFRLSIISNGYLMDDTFISEWARDMQVIGISADSDDAEVNARIGRCAKSNAAAQIARARIAEIFRSARRLNPNVECKLNTVVNAANWRTDMRRFVKETSPDRWKIFQMLPLADTPAVAGKQLPLVVSREQFVAFLDRHADFLHIMMPEDNDAMTDSYLMVDPLGRLYQNIPDSGGYRHIVSDPVHIAGIGRAVEQVSFDRGKFVNRYIPLYNERVDERRI